MAAVSDVLWAVTIGAYLVAMIAYAAEYAFSSRPRALALRAPAAMRVPAPLRESAPLRVPAPEGGPPLGAEPDEGSPPQTRPQPGWLAQLAAGALLLAVVVHLATTVTRGIAAGRMPWGNMYEYALSATLVAAAAFLYLLYRFPGLRHLGLYVALVNVLLLGLAGTVAYTPVEPLVPALDSYWFIVHVAAAALASGVFLVGFVGAVMYLIRAGYEAGRRRFPYPLGERIPGAELLERLSFRMHAFGFPIWTFAVAAGAIWAEASWGRYWGWDPKEVWAFITWVIYAAYLHARATPSVKRTVVAWLAIAGWVTVMMNLFGVNMFFESLHSYA